MGSSSRTRHAVTDRVTLFHILVALHPSVISSSPPSTLISLKLPTRLLSEGEGEAVHMGFDATGSAKVVSRLEIERCYIQGLVVIGKSKHSWNEDCCSRV